MKNGAILLLFYWSTVQCWTCHRQRKRSLLHAALPSESDSSDGGPPCFNGTVTILDEGKHHVVVSKPPTVLSHHSPWTGSRSTSTKKEFPMLQRTREAVGQRVNLVHRLDRGASGCLLLTKVNNSTDSFATNCLQEAMSKATKTYIAIVRGEGIIRGRILQNEGWFELDKPVKNENGNYNNATTEFRFISGQGNEMGTIDRARASLVLCRPKTGRWHQIRQHLAGRGLSHPILGDTSHGDNTENNLWKKHRGMPYERTCLHLVKLELPATEVCPDGLTVSCPLAPDLLKMLQDHLPAVLEDAIPLLREEGIHLEAITESESTRTVPVFLGM